MKIKFFLILLFSFFVSIFISCSASSHEESFTSALDRIDMYISMQNPKDALEELKNLEKKAYSSYERLGIYKRYILLNENQSAQKVLVEGLKNLPDNLELCAVYSQFLMRNSNSENLKTEDIFPYASKLLGTKYESIYSEYMIRLAMQNAKDFFTQEFVSIFENAYKSSSDSKWLFNAAAIHIKNGDFNKAASLYPKKIQSLDDALFWACVSFDNGFYSQSLDALLLEPKFATETTNDTRIFEFLALESDNYFILGENQEAFNIRNKIIENWKNLNAFEKIDLKKSPKVSFVEKSYANNVAYYASLKDDEKRYETLTEALEFFPDSEEILSLYGNFALELYLRPTEDEFLQELRRRNLKTLQMEKKDAFAGIEFADVFNQFEYSLSLENSLRKNPSVIVKKQMFEDEVNRNESSEKSNVQVWTLLERNSDKDGNLDLEIVHYGISKFIQNKSFNDARRLFEKYIKNKNDEDCKLWELEYKAWFAAEGKNIKEAFELYSKIIKIYENKIPVSDGQDNSETIINSYINIAFIYEGLGKNNLAMESLNKAFSKTNSAKEKSEILYRMALISYTSGDEKNAIRSLQYSLNLDSENKNARLLLKKVLKS